VLATAVDDHGLRLITREALPFACLGHKASLKYSAKWSGSKDLDRKLKLLWKVGKSD
jgi:hypothetical protein